jgi:hypothetical protein
MGVARTAPRAFAFFAYGPWPSEPTASISGIHVMAHPGAELAHCCPGSLTFASARIGHHQRTGWRLPQPVTRSAPQTSVASNQRFMHLCLFVWFCLALVRTMRGQNALAARGGVETSFDWIGISRRPNAAGRWVSSRRSPPEGCSRAPVRISAQASLCLRTFSQIHRADRQRILLIILNNMNILTTL